MAVPKTRQLRMSGGADGSEAVKSGATDAVVLAAGGEFWADAGGGLEAVAGPPARVAGVARPSNPALPASSRQNAAACHNGIGRRHQLGAGG